MHPNHAHRQSKVEHSRVAHITKGYASGGAVHADAGEDAAQIKHMVKKAALKVHGKGAKHRADRPMRASGGRVNKSGKTTVNVVIAPQGGDKPPMMPPGVGAMPPMAPKPPIAPPMAGPPPGGPPMMPPPGMPHARGGRAYAKGGAVKSGPGWTESMTDRKPFVLKSANNKDDAKQIGRGKPVTYKRGGAVEASNSVSPASKLPGGAGGGEGRLAKARRARAA